MTVEDVIFIITSLLDDAKIRCDENIISEDLHVSLLTYVQVVAYETALDLINKIKEFKERNVS